MIFLLPFSLFCQRILSPVEGTFANWQPLIINLNEGEEAFYSYSSSESKNDPLTSGFAYDGPVLIEQSGAVNLRIAVVSLAFDFEKENPESELESKNAEKKVERYEIKYRVQENSSGFDKESEESSFFARISASPILPLSSDFSVPPSLKYSLGDDDKIFLDGASLSVSAANCLSRLVPCSVTDGKSIWRFVLGIKARSAEQFLKNENFPFKITEWNKVEFIAKNLIWQLDDGFWSSSKEPFFIDRSVPHILRWQSLDYKKENPVDSFVLPPKPELEKVYDNRAAVFSLKGSADYKMQIFSVDFNEKEIKNPQNQNQNLKNDFLYSQIVFDALEGENFSGKAKFAVFCNGVFQGFFSDEYDVDKKPPRPPAFDASTPGFYARSDVNLKISAEYGAKIFYAFSGPHALESGNYSENSPVFDEYSLSDFKSYNYKNFLLRAGKKSAVFYKIASYAVDRAGNKSAVSEYRLIIDKFNYFIDFSSAVENPDGSGGRPFNKIEQILKVINSSDYSHFFVTGNFNFSGGETLIKSNCAFTGTGSAKSKIIFAPDSFVSVKNSSISFANCLIEKNFFESENSTSKMIALENSAADFNSCQIYGNFSESGILINSVFSAVNLNSSQISAQSPFYACAVSALKSEVSVKSCDISCSSESASIFSVSSSSLNLENSALNIFCRIGRIIESKNSNLKMKKNKFKSLFEEKKSGQITIYKDSKTLIIENSENTSEINAK